MSSAAAGGLRVADLRIEPGLRRVLRGDEELSLPGLSFDLLMALIEASPNLVSTDRLMEQVWRGQVVSPETITQRVKLLRDALGDDSQNPRYVAGVRGQGYRLVPPVEQANAARVPPVAQRSRRSALIALFVAFMLVAVAAFVMSRRDREAPRERPGASAKTSSLAVLPFENRSVREEDAFFADGVHDDLLSRLSRIRNLRVIGRASVVSYRDRRSSIAEIARDLDVAAVLTGAVQREGDQVRIQVQLIDAPRNVQLWAETYDRSLTAGNVFEIQSEISRAIASKLEIALVPADRERLDRPLTASLEAYDAWLKGRQEMNRYTSDGLRAAARHLQEALEADPDFALAHVALAETRLLQKRFRLLQGDMAVELAESSVARALALDPTLAEAFAAKGEVLRLRNDDRGAEEALRQAIALNPNLATARVNYGWLLADHGRTSEQMEMWRRAALLDPRAPAVQVYGAFSQLRSGQVEEAERTLRMMLEGQPDFPPALVILGEVRATQGDQADAVTHYRHALALNPHLPLAHGGLVTALLDLGLDQEAEEAVAEAWAVPETPELGPRVELDLLMPRRPRSMEERERMRQLIAALREVNHSRAAMFAALLDLEEGDAVAARAALEAAEPQLAASDGTDGGSALLQCTYALALIQEGAGERGRRLAKAVLARMDGAPAYDRRRHLAPVVCHAVLGDAGAVVASLREAAGPGRVPSAWRALLARPELDTLRGNRELEALTAAIRAEAARQRSRVTQISKTPQRTH